MFIHLITEFQTHRTRTHESLRSNKYMNEVLDFNTMV